MTQKEKSLLLKDLCSRLPYDVKIELMPVTRCKCVTLTPVILQDYFISDNVNYLPYLRPMSSMTDDERKEYKDIVKNTIDFYDCPKSNDVCFFVILIDWLNARHLDYCGLIPMGIALEAPEGMYNLKEK